MKTVQQQLETTKNTLVSINKKINDAQNKKSKLDSKLVASTTTRTNLKNQLPATYTKKSQVQAALESIRAEQQHIVRTIQDAQSSCEQHKQAKKELQTLRTMLLDTNEEIEHCRLKNEQSSAALISTQERRQSIASRLSYQSLEEAQNQANVFKTTAQKIDDTINRAKKLTELADNKNSELLGKQNTLQKQLNELPKIDREEQLKKQQELKTLRQTLTNVRDTAQSSFTNNTTCLKKFETMQTESQQLIIENNAIRELSDVACGNLRGSSRINFETYLQTMHFDRVLVAANKRLNIMTNGRYKLIRRTTASNKVSKTGLDLDVYDYNTGRSRDAGSLSGGESFKASLALALGLSDIVQMNAGGIELDTMFIDEGFGSLDQESLTLAIHTLTELSGNGKLIGIISHVEELKNSIDNKIVVSSGPNGSTLNIED